MKKLFFIESVFCTALYSHAQYASFENFTIAPESALYGQDQVIDGDTIYQVDAFNFENNYNAGWGSFSGWAISNVTDNTTTGWSNQYSAITGAGEGGSESYGICYATAWEGNRIFNTSSIAHSMNGFFVTNTTYAYYAMLNGDSFTKPFGADTNALGMVDGTNGEDWFLLTVYGLGLDSLRTGDSVNFYLADFTFSDDSQDYILDYWEWVDLAPLGAVKGIEFELHSTDTSGGWGMNNPAYFAMDNLGDFFSVPEVENAVFNFYPNPVHEQLFLDLKHSAQVDIYSLSGSVVQTAILPAGKNSLDILHLESGVYFISVLSDGKMITEKFVKY